MKDNVVNLLKWSEEEKENGMANIRDNEDKFKTFLDVVMVHMIPARKWKREISCMLVSDIFTSSDEAMSMLFVENYLSDFLEMIRTGNKVELEESKAKYTKWNDEGKGFKGWHISGVNRFNELVNIVRKKRSDDNSKQMEQQMLNDFEEYVGNMCATVSSGTSGDGSNNSLETQVSEEELRKYFVEATNDWDAVVQVPI